MNPQPFDKAESRKLVARYTLGEEIPVLWMANHLDDALRRLDEVEAERDLFLSIAERFWGGWEPTIPDEDGFEYQWVCIWQIEMDGKPVALEHRDVEPMTPDEIAWFKARDVR
jgi:hypothetical protein